MRPPFTSPPVDEREYFPRSEHDRIRREPYSGGASSRLTPADYPRFDPGTWRIDDRFTGAYGRAIEELVEFHPRDLTPTEFDWRAPKESLRFEGRWDDVLRYADWLKRGLEPPPVEVVATNGALRVTEGHRRLAATDLTGLPIKAWVSWSLPQPEGLRDASTGQPIPVGMTYELVHGRRSVNGDDDAFIEGESVVYGPLSGGAYVYRLGHAAQTVSPCETMPPRGSLRVRLEDGALIELDCDNFTPLRRLMEDPDAVDRVIEDGSPALRALLEKREHNPAEPPVMRGRMLKPETKFDPKGWWMSEKLDGVRGWWTGSQLISRKGNVFAAPDWFTDGWPKDVVIDGEIFGGRGNFNQTSGIARRARPGPAWKRLVYFAFDLPQHPGTYEARMKELDRLVKKVDSPYLAAVPRMKIEGKDQLQLALEKIEHAGGEGLILVKPGSKYVSDKTENVLKVKRFEDAEGTVFDYEPGKGRHKGSVGALWIRDIEGREFKVGTGLTDDQRRRARRLFPPGTLITFRFFERTPSGKPRFPSFVRARAEEPRTRVPNVQDLKARVRV